MTKLIIATIILIISNLHEAMAQTTIKTDSKILVAYFSFPEKTSADALSGASRIVADGKLYGNTEYVANIIAENTNANIFQIKTTHLYPNQTHKELIDYVKKEAETKTYPKIAHAIADFNDYDVVFVGYPNWWYDMPMVIYTLFREYSFKGKTVVLFCTHGGSGFSDSVQTIKKLEREANVLSIPAISNRSVTSSKNGLVKWLRDNGFSSN